MDIYIDNSCISNNTAILSIDMVSDEFSNLRVYTRNGNSGNEIGYLISPDNKSKIDIYLTDADKYPLVGNKIKSYLYAKIEIEYTSLVKNQQPENVCSPKKKICALSVRELSQPEYYITSPVGWRINGRSTCSVLVPVDRLQLPSKNISESILSEDERFHVLKIDMDNPVVTTEPDGRYKYFCLPSKMGAVVYKDVKDHISEIQIVYTLIAGGKISNVQKVSGLFIILGIILFLLPAIYTDFPNQLVSGFALVLSYGVLILAHYYTYLSMRHNGYFFINNKKLQRNIVVSLCLAFVILLEYLMFALFPIHDLLDGLLNYAYQFGK